MASSTLHDTDPEKDSGIPMLAVNVDEIDGNDNKDVCALKATTERNKSDYQSEIMNGITIGQDTNFGYTNRRRLPVDERQHYNCATDIFGSNPNLEEDHGWAWTVCFACFAVHVIFDGIYFSVGVIFVEFLDYFGRSKRDTALIVSLCLGVGFLLGPLYAFLADRFGCRLIVVSGALLSTSAFVLSIFAPNVYVMYVTFGLMAGFGYGCVYLPSILAINNYFDERRALALGLCASGSGFGVLIFGPLTRYLIQAYTWKGAMLIHAGITLNAVPCGLIYLPFKHNPDDGDKGGNDKAKGNLTTKSKVGGDYPKRIQDECEPLFDNGKERTNDCFSRKQRNTDALQEESYCHTKTSCDELADSNVDEDDPILEYKRCHKHKTNGVDSPNVIERSCHNGKSSDKTTAIERGHMANLIDDKATDKCNAITQAELQPINRADGSAEQKKVDIPLYRNCPYMIFLIASSLGNIVYVAPFAFIPDKAKEDGIDDFVASWLISTLGISGLIGRIICGFVSSIKCVDRVLLNVAYMIAIGVCIALLPVCTTEVPLFVCCVVLGFSLGGTVPLSPVLVGDFVGKDNMAKPFGVLNAAWGIVTLAGPPFIGWLYDVSGSYHISLISAGSIYAAGGLVLALVPLCKMEYNTSSS